MLKYVLFACCALSVYGQSKYQISLATKYPNDNPQTLDHPGAVCTMYGDYHYLGDQGMANDVVSSFCPTYHISIGTTCASGCVLAPAEFFDWISFLPWVDEFLFAKEVIPFRFQNETEPYYNGTILGSRNSNEPRVFNGMDDLKVRGAWGSFYNYIFMYNKVREFPKLITVVLQADCSRAAWRDGTTEKLNLRMAATKADRYINFELVCTADKVERAYSQILVLPADNYINYMIPTAHEWFGDSVIDNLDFEAGPITQFKKQAWIRYQPVFLGKGITKPDAVTGTSTLMSSGLSAEGGVILLDYIREAIHQSLAMDTNNPLMYEYLFQHQNITEGEKINNMTFRQVYKAMNNMESRYIETVEALEANITKSLDLMDKLLNISEARIHGLETQVNISDAEVNTLNYELDASNAKVQELEEKLNDVKSCAQLVRKLNKMNAQVMTMDPVTHRYMYGSVRCLQSCRLQHLGSLLT